MKDEIERLQQKDRCSTQLLEAFASSRRTGVQQIPEDKMTPSPTTSPNDAGPDPGCSNPRSMKIGSRTCNACKFRHQRCDGSRPSCSTCRERRIDCRYTSTSASMVERPTFLRKPSEELQGEIEEGESNRPKSFISGAADAVNARLPSLSEAASKTAENELPLSMYRRQRSLVSTYVGEWKRRPEF